MRHLLPCATSAAPPSVEYALMIAGIAIAIIAGVTMFGLPWATSSLHPVAVGLQQLSASRDGQSHSQGDTMLDKFITFMPIGRDEERGATAVEYGLMVALIAVAIITTVTALGGGLNGLFTSITGSL